MDIVRHILDTDVGHILDTDVGHILDRTIPSHGHLLDIFFSLLNSIRIALELDLCMT